MKQLFGVTNHNIVTVTNSLRQFRESLPEEKRDRLRFTVLSFDEQPDFDKHNIFLIPTAKKFLKHIEEFNESDAIVYIFDTPVLCDNLQPIDLLDVETKTHTYRYVYRALNYDLVVSKLREAIRNRENVEVTKETVNVIPTMLSELKGSIVQILFTYLYTIKDTDRKDMHRDTVLQWLQNKDSIDTLKAELTKLNQGKVSKALVYLVTKLEGLNEIVGKTKDAFIEIQRLRGAKMNKKTGLPLAVPYKKVAEKYNVDAFDLRYVMKMLRMKPQIENESFSDIYKRRRTDGSGKKKIKVM